MNFAAAMVQVLDGAPMRRQSWPAGDQIQVQTPDEFSKMTQPYLYLNTDDNIRIPYVMNQSDIFAQDWVDVIGDMVPSGVDPLS